MAQKKLAQLHNNHKLILKHLLDTPEGLRVKTLLKLTNLKRRSLYRHLNYLKDKRFVANVKPIWKCLEQGKKLTHLLKSDKPIQLHDISFVLRLMRTPYWWKKKENKLMRLKDFHYKKNIKWGNYPYTQLKKGDYLIQFHSNSIIFISQKPYYGNDSYNCFIESLQDAIDLLNYIEERFNFNFFPDNIPAFSVRSSHFVKLRDAIADKCKDRGKGFEVYINNEIRALVDMSFPLGMENTNKNFNIEDNYLYTKFVGDIIQNKTPLPSKQYKKIEEIKEIQDELVLTHKETLERLKDISEDLVNTTVVLEQLKNYIKKQSKEKE